MRTPNFFLQKLQIFRKLWYVRTDNRKGVEAVRISCRQGGQFFTKVFYQELLFCCQSLHWSVIGLELTV